MAAATGSTAAQTIDAERGERHRGPSLALLACVSVGLFVASIVLGQTMTGGTPYPTPFEPPESARAYYGLHGDVVRVMAFLQLGSAVVLGLFAATVFSRLQFLGLTVAGVCIGLFGGIAASILLAVSALSTWVAAQPGISDELGTLRALHLFLFATGGPGHVAALGLLMAGVSVPGAFMRLIPRWIVWMGLVLAVLAELSTLTLVLPTAAVLIPVARFPAFIWLIAVGFTLPSARGARTRE
jgi:hypothetical protein